MKAPSFPMLTLAIAMIVFGVCASAQDTKSASQADNDYQAWDDATHASPPTPFSDMSPLEKAQWREQHALQIRKAGLDFIEKHPNDPRRWTIVDDFSSDRPRFVKEWGGTNADGAATNVVVDKDAAAAWRAKVKELQGAMSKASDVPEEVRQRKADEKAMAPFDAASDAFDKDQKIDFDGLRKALTETLAKTPQRKIARTMFIYYVMFADKLEPARVEEICKTCIDSPNTNIAGFAKRKLNYLELIKQPLDITYTAVDGREVDLKKLRGKVVLVDFWATWCGPCLAELPNVKKVYAKYHDQGFEIVGISLESADLDPKDSPEETSAKLNKSKAALTRFTKKRNMPWPQYFDGKYWENTLATHYAVMAIPAMFLLDQDGRLVTAHAEGETLEKEVKRLLKL